MKKIGWFFFVFFAIVVGLYALLYFQVSENVGLLTRKSMKLLVSQVWWAAFNVHISFGGIALLIGWSQFSKKIRDKKIRLHRTLGKIYLIAVMFAGVAGFYLAIHSEGGIIANVGFSGMALAWLTTSTLAYRSIRKLQIDAHRAWMIISYALAFAAVTLRLYLPTFEIFFGMGFDESYTIIAWLCWVPNLFVAQYFIGNGKLAKAQIRK